MTGSGKTRLRLNLLEEAAIDRVPALIIDPKGDISTLLLTFPDLSPSDFLGWINADDAPDAYVAQQAALRKDGLAQWGQGGERIRQLLERDDEIAARLAAGRPPGLPPGAPGGG